MNITKENFNQYVAIARDLGAAGLWKEAADITDEAIIFWRDMDEKDSDEEMNVSLALQILTYCQWRECNDSDGYAILAEILKTNYYWSDEFIESNRNFTGAWILREKALAYHTLAANWATGRLYNVYIDYAQSYMERAIDVLNEIARKEADIDAAELCIDCKIDLAMIRRYVSNNLARNTAISIFGEKLSDEQKERLMDIYQEATDVIFDDYFNKQGIAAVQHCEVEGDEVKEEVLDWLLESYSEPGNDDLYWWLFTHKNSPEERKKIRFVEKIEDAADNGFEDIPWVFTLDRYPCDIEFTEGEGPEAAVYEIDTLDPEKYHKAEPQP